MADFLAIFDVDGTLVDSQAVIVDTMSRAFAAERLVPPPRDAVLSLVGISLPLLVARLIPDHAPDLQERVTANYRGFYRDVAAGGITLYRGVEAGLRRLRTAGITLGIATGKSRRGLDHLIDGQGWRDLFATVQCADDHPSKPHPSMVDRALLEAAAIPDRTAMIGDTTFDMVMGRAAGVPVLGVGWGYHPAAALMEAGAEAVLPDFATLVTTIEERAA